MFARSPFRRAAGATVLLAAALTTTPHAAWATDYTVTRGANFALAAQTTPSTAQQYAGSGSWYELYPGPKAEYYISPAGDLGTSFTIGEIQSITYRTVNGATNPSNVDFYVLLYTDPYVGGDGGSFYGNRLTGEPLYSNGYVAPTAGVWNTWTTPAGPNQLTFFDSNNCGNAGFNGAPTLADVQAGPINWSTWPANPTQGGSDPNPIDYASQNVRFVSLQTGSGWASFEGYVDALHIALTNGDTYTIDLEAAPDDIYVDDDWTGFPPLTPVGDGRYIGLNAFATIQGGVNAALPGATVQVAAGTYTEQVEIAKNVTVNGSGCASTRIVSPASLALSFTTGANTNKPIVYVHDATDARVQNLTIDGDGKGNANVRFIGIAYYNAGGKLLDACVEHVRDTPFSGTQHGVGVYAFNTTGGPYALEIARTSLTDFQKNGTSLNGTGLTVDVHDCTVTGAGYTSVTAQNGIQVSFDAAGTIARCAISNLGYTPATFVASGILAFDAASLAVSEMDGAHAITNVQAPVSWYDTPGSMDGMGVSGGADFGPIFVYNSSAGPGAARGNAARPRPAAAAFDAATPLAARRDAETLASYAVSVTNSCLSGADVAGTVGVWAYTEGGPLAVTASNNVVHDWDVGFATFGAAASLDASFNSIASNVTAGYDNAGGAAQDAEFNWWGAADGPSGAGPGSGDAVVGAGVDFAPFLFDGTDLDAECGFTPQGPVHNLNTDERFFTIQAGIDDADTQDGHVLAIGAGIYEEQVEVDKGVTLRGAGCGSTIIQSPPSLPLGFTTGAFNRPIVFVHDVASARIEHLTVDGLGRGNANFRFVGIGYWNAGGAIVGVCVVHVEDTPFSGVQHGNGILAANNTGGPYGLLVDSTSVTDFQKTGMVLSGAGLDADVQGCTVTGKGYTSVTAQNGIQVSGLAGGSITRTAISEMGYTPATFVASGVLAFGGATLDVSNLEGANAITNVQAPVSWYDTNGSMDEIGVSGGADYGPIFVYNSSVALGAARGHSTRRPPAASPEPDAIAAAAARGGAATLASYTVTVTNSCLDGADAAGTVGVFAYTEGGPLAVTATNNEVTDWDWGFYNYGAGATLRANFNAIASNVTAGYENDATAPFAQNAETNWWNAASGPSGAGPGSGDAVIGAGVDATPFLTSGSDLEPGCGFDPPLPVQNLNTLETFATIQSGIDDPDTQNGHTLRAQAGTYEGFTLNKRLVIQGARMGVAGCGRVTGAPNPAVESILSGPAPGPSLITLVTGSAGSAIDGFSVIGGTLAITSTSGPIDNVTLRNLHVAGFSGSGIFLNDTGTDVTITRTNVDGTGKAGSGALVHLDTDPFLGFQMTFCCIRNNAGGTGFFVDGNHNLASSAMRNPLLDDNRVESCVTGMNLGSRAFTGGTISDNDVLNNDFDGIQGGIKFTTISGNEFTGNGRWGIALTAFGNLAADRGARNNLLTRNVFTANDSAGYFVSAAMAAGHAASNRAHINDFVGNGGWGAVYRGTELFDVECNWWGHIAGPDYPPANPNPPGDGLFASSAKFAGWLNGPIASNPSCNQLGFPTVVVDAPNGGEILTVSTMAKLAWTATDNVGVVSVDLRLSRDNGTTWEDLALGEPNDGTYDWLVTGPVTTEALLEVTAYDGGGNTGVDVSNATFTIDEATAVLVAQFQTETVDEGIAVRWSFGDPRAVASSWIERAARADGPWTRIEADPVLEAGTHTVIDRAADPGSTWQYRLVARLDDGRITTFGPIAGTAGETVREFALARIAPNPFAETARIEYAVARETIVRLRVLDLQGRTVATLVDGVQRPGRHVAVWSGESDRGRVPAGVYFVRYEAGGRSMVKRILFAR